MRAAVPVAHKGDSLLLEGAIFILTMLSIRHFHLQVHLARNSSIIHIILRDGQYVSQSYAYAR